MLEALLSLYQGRKNTSGVQIRGLPIDTSFWSHDAVRPSRHIFFDDILYSTSTFITLCNVLPPIYTLFTFFHYPLGHRWWLEGKRVSFLNSIPTLLITDYIFAITSHSWQKFQENTHCAYYLRTAQNQIDSIMLPLISFPPIKSASNGEDDGFDDVDDR